MKYLWGFILISLISITALFFIPIYKAILIWFGATAFYLFILFLGHLFGKSEK